MAFDFVSYIHQQIEQQSFSNTQAPEKPFLIHLISLQLAELIDLIQHDAGHTYEKIKQTDAAWLSNHADQFINNDALAHSYFHPQLEQQPQINQQIAQTILQELRQLDDNAGLGILGIQELLEGQYNWMQEQIEPWFWDSIGHPEYKTDEQSHSDSTPNFNEVMKEFNQMIHQQIQHDDEQSQELQPTAAITIPEASTLFKCLNPLIALAIIIWLFFVAL